MLSETGQSRPERSIATYWGMSAEGVDITDGILATEQ